MRGLSDGPEVGRVGAARMDEGEGGSRSLDTNKSSLPSLFSVVSQGPVSLFVPMFPDTMPPVTPTCPYNHAYRQLEVCLGEVENAQLFVGILGSRYGYIPPSYNLPDHPHFHWVRQTGLEEGWGRSKGWGRGREKPHSVRNPGTMNRQVLET